MTAQPDRSRIALPGRAVWILPVIVHDADGRAYLLAPDRAGTVCAYRVHEPLAALCRFWRSLRRRDARPEGVRP